jgi:hypothetical protein
MPLCGRNQLLPRMSTARQTTAVPQRSCRRPCRIPLPLLIQPGLPEACHFLSIHRIIH